jgi:alpha-mannosidase
MRAMCVWCAAIHCACSDSTPSHYTDSKHAATLDRNATWEVRTDDTFPLGDNSQGYWTGYFSSRPALKRQVRMASNFLSAARQIEVMSGVTAAEVATPTVRPSPPVGSSWTDSFEGTIGVATHHDGISGTEKQAVADE